MKSQQSQNHGLMYYVAYGFLFIPITVCTAGPRLVWMAGYTLMKWLGIALYMTWKHTIWSLLRLTVSKIVIPAIKHGATGSLQAIKAFGPVSLKAASDIGSSTKQRFVRKEVVLPTPSIFQGGSVARARDFDLGALNKQF
ncbi:hypothetical protein [Noviherbaspirillum pedocola]|uniref:Uncharacterized protein n=1 Tax=Noviherbaspirillum pedocola TaxID=2801341 RepID=A0A934W769_9BURK|nr:hypothetical protein [Noviherbaspirillum pedocola]MBK4736015.1 hypothetical protein [Noviherbaspirillum pedocola]